MRIVLQTTGYRGDIIPFIALGNGLIRAGHSVLLLLSPIDRTTYEIECARLGVPVRHIPSYGILLTDSQHRDIMLGQPPFLGFRRMLSHVVAPNTRALFEAAVVACANADLLISNSLLYPSRAAALVTGIPNITVTLDPAALTGAIASTPTSRLQQRLLSPIIDPLINASYTFALKNIVTPFLESFKQTKDLAIFPDLFISEILDLIPCGKLFRPAHSTWSPPHEVTGIWSPPDLPSENSIPFRLEEFLRNGPPPVFMTLGSMHVLYPDESLLLFCEAANYGKFRAIVQTSPKTGFPHGVSDGDIFYVHNVDYAHVFHECRGIVHHGSPGTVHQALLAGVPSTVLAFTRHALRTGERLAHFGAGTSPLKFKDATPPRLAERGKELIESRLLRQRSQELQKRTGAERGVESAIKLIESAVSKTRR